MRNPSPLSTGGVEINAELMAYVFWDLDTQTTVVTIAPCALTHAQCSDLQEYLEKDRRTRFTPRIICDDLEPLVEEYGPPGVKGFAFAAPAANLAPPPPPSNAKGWGKPDGGKGWGKPDGGKGKFGKGRGKKGKW